MTELNIDELRTRMATRYAAAPLPPMVILDITNTCNLKCIHCPQPILQARSDFKPNHMRWDYFTKVVDEIGSVDQPMLIRIAGDGEPTIHPRIMDMIKYVKANCKAVLNLTTNGLVTGREQADEMLNAGIDFIDFSIDAFSKPVYDMVRRGGKYERLIANIMNVLDRRQALRAKTKIMVSFVAQKENQHETEKFREFWTPLVDRVLVRQLHSAVGQVKQEESRERNRAGERKRFPCPHLWKRLTVDFRGQVKFCAHDWVFDAGVTLGNIGEASLQEIWKGSRLATLRHYHETDSYPKGEVCTNCTDWASTRWDLGYERLIDKVVYQAPTLATELSIAET
jgi:MoaA/NifB/PqqE/SkfB family radical SAM enzyme